MQAGKKVDGQDNLSSHFTLLTALHSPIDAGFRRSLPPYSTMMVPWQQWAHSRGDSGRMPEGEATQAGDDRELREGPHSRLLDLVHVAGFGLSPSLGILPRNPPQSIGIVTREAWGWKEARGESGP